MRIASLLPAATEMVYALGLGDDLVAVTFECDFPAQARVENAVVVSGADLSGLSPAEIDAHVRARREAGEDLYVLDRDALGPAAPDVVLTQDLCRVCALPTDRVDEALAHLGCSAEVVTLDPSRLTDVLDDVRRVAAACEAVDAGERVVGALQDRLDAVASAVRGRPRRPVAVVEWVDPLFLGGHWIPDMLQVAGGEVVAGHPGQASGPSEWAALVDASPEVVVVAPCGFGLDGAAEQAALVAENVPAAEVWAIDGDAVVVRPGPRLVDGVEAFASVLHPDAVPPSVHVRRIA